MSKRRPGTANSETTASGAFGRQDQYGLDWLVLLVSLGFSYLLRFDFAIPKENLLIGVSQAPLVLLVQFASLYFSGVYAFVWRYVGLGEVKTFVKASAWSFVVLLVLRLALPGFLSVFKVPLSIIFMDSVFSFLGILGLR